MFSLLSHSVLVFLLQTNVKTAKSWTLYNYRTSCQCAKPDALWWWMIQLVFGGAFDWNQIKYWTLNYRSLSITLGMALVDHCLLYAYNAFTTLGFKCSSTNTRSQKQNCMYVCRNSSEPSVRQSQNLIFIAVIISIVIMSNSNRNNIIISNNGTF